MGGFAGNFGGNFQSSAVANINIPAIKTVTADLCVTQSVKEDLCV